jgi:probable HAF family extracellular repeat protein
MTKWLIRIFGGECMRKLSGIVFSAVLLLIVSAPGTWAQKVKVYDLGTYPGGSWAEMGRVNDFDVAVAQGDVTPGGDNHLLALRLFGPRGPQWSDLGAIDAYEGWFTWPDIADTGVIAAYAATSDGYVHAFAWTEESGRVDLGTLADISSNYASYKNSGAQHLNKLGTAIAGWSQSITDGNYLPVVWTRDGPDGAWKIHELDTAGYPHGMADVVNDSGQVSGFAYNDAGIYIPLLWNPILGRGKWRTIELPRSADWPDVSIPGGINNAGEIVGDVSDINFVYGYASLWQPVDRQRTTYKLTLLANVAGLPYGDFAETVNDLGDIVGGTHDENWNTSAARWSTKDPTFVRLLGFPGDFSFAEGVNNQGIAVGLYLGGTCANECVAAAKFR